MDVGGSGWHYKGCGFQCGQYFQMNDDRKQYQNQIIPKKAIRTNDQESNNKKKGKKYKRKEQWEQPAENYQRQPLKHQSPSSLNNPPNNIKQEEEDIFKQLCTILSSYKPSTIKKILVENHYKKTESINILFDMLPDNEDEDLWGREAQKVSKLQYKKGSEDKSSSTNHSEIANNLLNEVYDNFLKEEIEEINGKEFEELFEEIAELIKEDQKDRGMGVYEINNFVDQCNSVKQTLLIGFREELSNFDDFQFDQSYPLYTQTQIFLETTIKKQAKKQKKLEEDFPLLGMNSNPKKPQKNIIDRIHHQKKKQKQQGYLFTPSKNVHSQYAKQKSNEVSIFNVDNKLKSQRDLMSLHKEFSDVPIRDLKFVYKTFVGDYNICREFLIKYYDDKRNRNFESRALSQPVPKPVAVRIHASRMRKEEIDEQLKHLSLKEIREEIDHLFKLRQALQLTKMKIKSSNQKLELDRMINEKAPLIKKLSQASRVKQVEQMRKSNPLYVDLHGYREEEIDSLLDSVTEMLREEYDLRNYKVGTKKVKGRLTACLIAMTGKGIHSRGNRSVLKPATADWCKGKDFDYEEEDDHIKIYIVMG